MLIAFYMRVQFQESPICAEIKAKGRRATTYGEKPLNPRPAPDQILHEAARHSSTVFEPFDRLHGAGGREIDEGIGAAAAERNDMIAFDLLVRAA